MTGFGDAVTDAGVGASAPTPAVSLRGIEKRFGAVRACDSVDLDLYRGRIHGILGENGAGKSTLMKMLIGLVLPDGGRINIDGVERRIHEPTEAARLGIGMVHQHFSLVDALTVWENVSLGDSGQLDSRSIRNRVGEIGNTTDWRSTLTLGSANSLPGFVSGSRSSSAFDATHQL